jgi:F0F1-type ATP synthase assembly protein I
MGHKPGSDEIGRGFGAGYALVSAGFQLAFTILFFLGGGYLLDRWLHTRPIFTVIGIAVGLAAGMYAFMRRVMAEAGGNGTRKRERGDDRG